MTNFRYPYCRVLLVFGLLPQLLGSLALFVSYYILSVRRVYFVNDSVMIFLNFSLPLLVVGLWCCGLRLLRGQWGRFLLLVILIGSITPIINLFSFCVITGEFHLCEMDSEILTGFVLPIMAITFVTSLFFRWALPKQ